MTDLLSLEEHEIASYSIWKQVWDRDHSDLVMRAHKNVDHKDKVGIKFKFSAFFNYSFHQVRENLRLALTDRRGVSLLFRQEIRALRSIYRRTIAAERAFYYREIQYAACAPTERIS